MILSHCRENTDIVGRKTDARRAAKTYCRCARTEGQTPEKQQTTLCEKCHGRIQMPQ
jgi:Zn finger protein HypA/HybF involved in hydrogenase expression